MDTFNANHRQHIHISKLLIIIIIHVILILTTDYCHLGNSLPTTLHKICVHFETNQEKPYKMEFSKVSSVHPLFQMSILFGILVHASMSHQSYQYLKSSHKVDCAKSSPNNADLDSLEIYPSLNFKAKWTMDQKYFWKSTDFDFEARYIKETKQLPQVKVFVLPFSHNDPGWKQTYEVYFYLFTKKILTNAITKLTEYKNMTFAWSEVSFLSKWWDEASYAQKETLRRLVKEGRFEILTGGWVMADEATTSVFALITQLVEGHQWIKKHLRIMPNSAWSIDAFGHGSTMPYLLKQAEISGMMIQRVHYAWKHWLAEHREGDFLWIPRWSSKPEKDGIHCHNAHYDLYPTKHSCGPNPNICMRFDFRVLEGVREEHTFFVQHADTRNTHRLAESLTGQYRRTASLTQHNSVIASLGGDFRFEHLSEWDQQYASYKRLFGFINSHQKLYQTSAQFGTLSNYFKAVQESNVTLSTFTGDFFPYTDVIFHFAPGHWTGYYSTRPFWKKLSRETENELSKAEILFTFTYNLLRQNNHSREVIQVLFRNYDNLVYARRSIALFQHHDGITGTSPRNTMLDYARKLTQAWNFLQQIQRLAIESIWRTHLKISVPPLLAETQKILTTAPSQKVPVKLYQNASVVKKLIIFNSLAWNREQLVKMVMMTEETNNLIVRGPNGDVIVAQIATIQLDHTKGDSYELSFVAVVPALTVATFEISHQTEKTRSFANKQQQTKHVLRSKKYCKNCERGPFQDIIGESEIILENSKIKVYFDSDLGLLKQIEFKSKSSRIMNVNVTLSFGKYEAFYGSGAYLLHPFMSSSHGILDRNEASVYVIQGPVTSEVVLVTPTITLKSWILHIGSSEAMSVVHLSLQVNGTASHAFGEFFMRLQSDLNNTESTNRILTSSHDKPNPVLYTDTNGFSVEKRRTLSKLPYQANHFPITNFAFIQDPTKSLRLSLLVDRSHGVSSVAKGRLEILFDRRLRYDDARGMDEGVVDLESTISNYIIALEQIEIPKSVIPFDDFKSWEPSIQIQKLSKILNHEPTIFTYDALSTHKSGGISLFSHPFPDDVHLLNLQTLSANDHLEDIKSAPSTKALLILQRLGHYYNKPHDSMPSSSAENSCNQQQHYHDGQLNSTILINHTTKRTNLVGTKEYRDYNQSAASSTTNFVSIGGPHELSAFLIKF